MQGENDSEHLENWVCSPFSGLCHRCHKEAHVFMSFSLWMNLFMNNNTIQCIGWWWWCWWWWSGWGWKISVFYIRSDECILFVCFFPFSIHSSVECVSMMMCVYVIHNNSCLLHQYVIFDNKFCWICRLSYPFTIYHWILKKYNNNHFIFIRFETVKALWYLFILLLSWIKSTIYIHTYTSTGVGLVFCS